MGSQFVGFWLQFPKSVQGKNPGLLCFKVIFYIILLLMEETLHHLFYMKSYETWDILNLNSGFLPSTVCHLVL